MLEKEIEKAVCKEARKRGWWERKFSSPGRRAVPDRILGRTHVLLFIEFKALGETATKAQLHEHDLIRAQGFQVYVIDSIEDGLKLLASLDNSFQNLTKDPLRFIS